MGYEWMNAGQTRMCDYCGKEPVKIFFKRMKDLEEFLRHRSIPRTISSYYDIYELENGRMFHHWDLKINVVVCDKCLSRSIDPKTPDPNVIFNSLAEKPHLIREAISCINRGIVEEQRGIASFNDQLVRYKNMVIRTEQEIETREKRLAADRRLREDFMNRMAQIKSLRQRLVRVLRAVVNKKNDVR